MKNKIIQSVSKSLRLTEKENERLKNWKLANVLADRLSTNPEKAFTSLLKLCTYNFNEVEEYKPKKVHFTKFIKEEAKNTTGKPCNHSHRIMDLVGFNISDLSIRLQLLELMDMKKDHEEDLKSGQYNVFNDEELKEDAEIVLTNYTEANNNITDEELNKALPTDVSTRGVWAG